MSTTLFLMGSVLIFWGWQTNMLVFGLIMAVSLEISRIIPVRWQFERSDFRRAADLCILCLLGSLIYLLLLKREPGNELALFQWLPMCLFPLMLCQAYSDSAKVDLSALFLVLRKKSTGDDPFKKAIDISYPYLALCLFAASNTFNRTHEFYIGLCVLVGWALWKFRNKRYPVALWAALLLISTGAGFIGHLGLNNLQQKLENIVISRFSGSDMSGADSSRTRTSIGEIGKLKLSDKILLRVMTDAQQPLPGYLQLAAYNFYSSRTWFAGREEFRTVSTAMDGSTWALRQANGTENTITIATDLKKDSQLLPIPDNTVKIAQLPASSLEMSNMGVVRVIEGQGFVRYEATYEAGKNKDILGKSSSRPSDLYVDEKINTVLTDFLAKNHLIAETPTGTAQNIARFLQNNFSYSLVQEKHESGMTPLENFLLKSKSGHCELFATATALLLRSAGIPSRYVTGYVVNEYSELEKCYIVRARHAHAWTQYYANGSWHTLDTTPPGWIAIEHANMSIFTRLYDLLSWCKYKISLWHQQQTGEGTDYLFYFLILPLIFVLAYRIYSKKKIRLDLSIEQQPAITIQQGKDSPFYEIEKYFNQSGYTRDPAESYSAWLKRLKTATTIPSPMNSLDTILELHNKYRFDPECDRNALGKQVEKAVQEWFSTNNLDP